jgi:hydroxymethylpyrimidine pyrophosphatase-like HAD family hydrolase
MVAIRLIATDLDDTLLRADKTISQRAYQLIQRAQAQGIHVVPVTARPPRTMREIGDILGVTGSAICCNGALVYDIGRTAIMRTSPIGPAIARQVAATLRDVAPGIQFGWEAGMRFGCEPGYAVANPVVNPGDWRDDALNVWEPLVKLLALHPTIEPLTLTDLAQRIVGDRVTVTNSGLPRVEMSPLGVDKGSGLAALCADLGILREEVVAFGDMLNDIAMLRWAGTGVAVANAHPDVLAVADAVTLACEEDGVAEMIERLLFS